MEAFNTAFSIGGGSLTWNGIVLAVSILVAVVVSGILVKKHGAYKDLALDACIIGIPAGLIGARLFAAISSKVAFASFFDLTKAGLNLPGAAFCGRRNRSIRKDQKAVRCGGVRCSRTRCVLRACRRPMVGFLPVRRTRTGRRRKCTEVLSARHLYAAVFH